MRIAGLFVLTFLLVAIQGSFLPLIVPQLYFYPALLALVVLSFRLERPWLLGLAIWTGLVTDMLYGESIGLHMFTHYVALAAALEISETWLDDLLLVCALRVVAVIIGVEIIQAVVFYVRGLSDNLFAALQINTGLSLAANLLLFGLFLLMLRLKGKDQIRMLLEGER